ncbi:serine/threonine-protein kinase/endoribonuclease IRE1 [Hylaeus volcanicus]|uniref:serine/threonine-protein kinase/endoribonuclease IRE1 n=1 Tax=Hylaeus volcanicus TaxID=313075 RepID=UPI0023B78EF2|nr:serine/threonine-protein kinase/endoribonuclease IRE1 [Hylaeus volcanicus]XP_053987935.1 serine/threonine-protein kinase/endoribonuclease IRE1 [Hylaeus volcanicus]XP_053987936.1 serine/threonine-protein kinase/endoribonuclease IRE1 [Hylaeus volcanicus]
MQLKLCTPVLLVIGTLFGVFDPTEQSERSKHPNPFERERRSTELMPEEDNPLLMFSTLDGFLVGIEQRSGNVLWRQSNEPIVKVPVDLSRASMPVFLPDPKDGSLYVFGTETEALKKLPFTIPELVANSPCRSSDGILYTGRKIDTWFSVDPNTGQREQLLGFDKVKNTCPVEMQNAVFVGRTEYNIIMVDSKQKNRKWNVTFYDYSAAKMEPEGIENYDLVHFTTSSTGRIVTIDRRLGIVLWELDVKSPVIAVYIVRDEGLLTVPFTSVADETLDLLLKRFANKPSDIQLFPTLYIGQHRHGLYALPSLVDSTTATISSNNIGQLLLEGPLAIPQLNKNDNSVPLPFNERAYVDGNTVAQTEYQTVITLGHYEVPGEYKLQDQQPLQITGRSDPVTETLSPLRYLNSTKEPLSLDLTQTDSESSDGGNSSVSLRELIRNTYTASKSWLNQQENKGLKLALIALMGCIATMFWYLNAQFKEFQQLSQGSRESSRTDDYYGMRSNVLALPEDMGEGVVKVGKISFDTGQVLGKGCEGTFVYRGEFDGRSVAVKRLLPDCFTFADREVALLRESDAHANVVRYFCTEQDRMFRYIALELAEATLQDYVVGRYDREKISVKSILRQATSGLAHLHFLDIVHRDIKPHNVLLSAPGPRGEVRAMISDFGLCKKLQLGRVSFSRRSGITGTDGWIAPEMLNGNRTTCAVDIFSLGCVFYYVLSDGKHPFGDPLRRQANILCGEADLTALHEGMSQSNRELALILIKAMIASDPSERPPVMAVHDHPIFWESSRILGFFQDVSDRVEKDQNDSPALIALETDNDRVVRGDWRLLIDVEVATDLRKYRSYRGESVRDLLRALRNKKHHYRELSPEAQENLGGIPDKFTDYWLSRFPCLLSHVWSAMQAFRHEPTLRDYYHTDYKFANNICETETARMRNTHSTNYTLPSVSWRVRDNVDWSPNKSRYRGQRRKQEKKKIEVPLAWTLSSS